jgi:hypothetical protein
MQGVKGLLDSKRGVFCVLLVLCAMVLVIIGSITGQSWLDFAKWIAVTLVTGHTATTAIDQLIGGKEGSPAQGTPTPPPTAST